MEQGSKIYTSSTAQPFYELTLEAVVKNISQVRTFVDEHLETWGCPISAMFELDVAIEEIFVNIASYAYAPKTGAVTVRIERVQDPSGVSISFLDSGAPFNPLDIPDPDLTLSYEEREMGGLGIYMVRQSMDDISYDYRENRNVLQIRKNWED